MTSKTSPCTERYPDASLHRLHEPLAAVIDHADSNAARPRTTRTSAQRQLPPSGGAASSSEHDPEANGGWPYAPPADCIFPQPSLNLEDIFNGAAPPVRPRWPQRDRSDVIRTFDEHALSPLRSASGASDSLADSLRPSPEPTHAPAALYATIGSEVGASQPFGNSSTLGSGAVDVRGSTGSFGVLELLSSNADGADVVAAAGEWLPGWRGRRRGAATMQKSFDSARGVAPRAREWGAAPAKGALRGDVASGRSSDVSSHGAAARSAHTHSSPLSRPSVCDTAYSSKPYSDRDGSGGGPPGGMSWVAADPAGHRLWTPLQDAGDDTDATDDATGSSNLAGMLDASLRALVFPLAGGGGGGGGGGAAEPPAGTGRVAHAAFDAPRRCRSADAATRKATESPMPSDRAPAHGEASGWRGEAPHGSVDAIAESAPVLYASEVYDGSPPAATAASGHGGHGAALLVGVDCSRRGARQDGEAPALPSLQEGWALEGGSVARRSPSFSVPRISASTAGSAFAAAVHAVDDVSAAARRASPHQRSLPDVVRPAWQDSTSLRPSLLGGAVSSWRQASPQTSLPDRVRPSWRQASPHSSLPDRVRPTRTSSRSNFVLGASRSPEWAASLSIDEWSRGFSSSSHGLCVPLSRGDVPWHADAAGQLPRMYSGRGLQFRPRAGGRRPPSEHAWTPQLSFDGLEHPMSSSSFEVFLGPRAIRATMLMACPFDKVTCIQQSYLWKRGRWLKALVRRWYFMSSDTLHVAADPFAPSFKPLGRVTAATLVRAPRPAEGDDMLGVRFEFEDGTGKTLFGAASDCRGWVLAAYLNTREAPPQLDSLLEVRPDQVIAEGGFSVALKSAWAEDVARVLPSPELCPQMLRRPPLCLKIRWESDREATCAEDGDLAAPSDASRHRELTILAALDEHPNVMRVHAALGALYRTYIVSDYYEGGHLLQHIATLEVYTEWHAANLTAQLARALAHIHAAGIAHLDVKPENIVFDRAGCLKLIDFGVASFMGQSCQVAGTPEYMSPELTEAQSVLPDGPSHAEDMWALGVVVYLMLTGTTPFFGTSLEAVRVRVTSDADAYKRSAAWLALSADAREFIGNCLCRDPAARWTAQQALKSAWIQSAALPGHRDSAPPLECHAAIVRLNVRLDVERSAVVQGILNMQAATQQHRDSVQHLLSRAPSLGCDGAKAAARRKSVSSHGSGADALVAAFGSLWPEATPSSSSGESAARGALRGASKATSSSQSRSHSSHAAAVEAQDAVKAAVLAYPDHIVAFNRVHAGLEALMETVSDAQASKGESSDPCAGSGSHAAPSHAHTTSGSAQGSTSHGNGAAAAGGGGPPQRSESLSFEAEGMALDEALAAAGSALNSLPGAPPQAVRILMFARQSSSQSHTGSTRQTDDSSRSLLSRGRQDSTGALLTLTPSRDPAAFRRTATWARMPSTATPPRTRGGTQTRRPTSRAAPATVPRFARSSSPNRALVATRSDSPPRLGSGGSDDGPLPRAASAHDLAACLANDGGGARKASDAAVAASALAHDAASPLAHDAASRSSKVSQSASSDASAGKRTAGGLVRQLSRRLKQAVASFAARPQGEAAADPMPPPATGATQRSPSSLASLRFWRPTPQATSSAVDGQSLPDSLSLQSGSATRNELPLKAPGVDALGAPLDAGRAAQPGPSQSRPPRHNHPGGPARARSAAFQLEPHSLQSVRRTSSGGEHAHGSTAAAPMPRSNDPKPSGVATPARAKTAAPTHLTAPAGGRPPPQAPEAAAAPCRLSLEALASLEAAQAEPRARASRSYVESWNSRYDDGPLYDLAPNRVYLTRSLRQGAGPGAASEAPPRCSDPNDRVGSESGE